MKKTFATLFAGAFLALAGLAPAAEAGGTVGYASYYRSGHRTASGERFNPKDYTAAHRSLPFGTKVLVTNLANGKSVIVRINDRGPFSRNRIIDLSLAAAQLVGITGSGVGKVKIVVLG
jgi:rare lipoprotein A